MEIISRADAKARGLKFYFTGKPCGRGGIAPRRLGGACTCHACSEKMRARLRDNYRNMYAENPEQLREKNRAAMMKWRAANTGKGARSEPQNLRRESRKGP